MDSSTLRIGPIGYPETPVRNLHYLLSNNPEERCPTRNQKGFLNLEDQTDRLSRNGGKKSPLLAE
jgi:hypothetical protein